jgi:hypothetical protein
VLATWLATAPAFVAYENWLFYSLPVAALLVLAALAFDRALRTGRTRDGVVFLAVLAVVCGARSLYHLVYLLAAVALLAVGWRDGRRAIAAGTVPLLLLAALYAKNAILFGHFAASTWTGMNLARLTTDTLPFADAQRLVAEGTLSPASLVPAFSWRVYPRSYFEGLPPSRVRALYWEEKTTGGPNFNHAAYIRISDDLLHDAAWVIRHHPRRYLASVGEAWGVYFRSPGDLRFLGAENIGALRPASDVYDAVFFGRWPGPGAERDALAPSPRYWGLIVGLPIVFGVGLAAALGRGPGRRLDRRQRLLAAFLCFNIAFVAVVGNFLELGENNRFRFETDPLSLCLLGLALQTGIALVPRRRTARRVSTGE